MESAESYYRRKIAKLPPKLRVAQSIGMYIETCKSLKKQILTEYGNISEREFKLRVAKRIYLTDPIASKLLDRLLNEYS
jgi:hypothetical protein